MFVNICCKYFAVFLFKKAIKELGVLFISLNLYHTITKLRVPGIWLYGVGVEGTCPSAPLPTPVRSLLTKNSFNNCIIYLVLKF